MLSPHFPLPVPRAVNPLSFDVFQIHISHILFQKVNTVFPPPQILDDDDDDDDNKDFD